MVFHPLPQPLTDDVLAKRQELPQKPAPVTLTGRYVRLEPFDMARDAEQLHAISNGQPVTIGNRSVEAYDADMLVWRWMNSGPFDTLEAFKAYMQAQLDAKEGQPFTVFDLSLGHPVGVANYMANIPVHLKIELGSIWYSPLAQRTNANTEATYLMLSHAFDLEYRRLEWKCNALNERSRKAALRMGFKFEGIQEAHYIVKGRSRDTAWFRILESEWAGVKQQLEAMLYPVSSTV